MGPRGKGGQYSDAIKNITLFTGITALLWPIKVWPTFSAILKARFAPYDLSAADITQVRAEFLKLSVSTARRMIRFWLVRDVAKANA
jgi:hypothetical protein